MATRDFHLVLRYQTNSDEQQFKTLKDLFIQFAREVNATALMLAGPNDTKPQVRIFSDDYFEGVSPDVSFEEKPEEGGEAATKSEETASG